MKGGGVKNGQKSVTSFMDGPYNKVDSLFTLGVAEFLVGVLMVEKSRVEMSFNPQNRLSSQGIIIGHFFLLRGKSSVTVPLML